MIAILKFLILFFFLYFLFRGILFLLRLLRGIYQIKRQFRDFGARQGQQPGGYTNTSGGYSNRSGGYSSQAGGYSGSGGGFRSGSTQTETIHDTRSTDERNRKIFSGEEGEYVEFEEEK